MTSVNMTLYDLIKMLLFVQAAENLGMAMVYTLVTSAKEWLSERFGQKDSTDDLEEEAAKDEVTIFQLSESTAIC